MVMLIRGELATLPIGDSRRITSSEDHRKIIGRANGSVSRIWGLGHGRGSPFRTRAITPPMRSTGSAVPIVRLVFRAWGKLRLGLERDHQEEPRGRRAMAEQGRAVGTMPRAESAPAEDRGNVASLVEPLQQAGWSIGDVALRGRGWRAGLDRAGTARVGPSDGQRPDARRGVAARAGPSRGGRDVAGSASAGERVGRGPVPQFFRFERTIQRCRSFFWSTRPRIGHLGHRLTCGAAPGSDPWGRSLFPDAAPEITSGPFEWVPGRAGGLSGPYPCAGADRPRLTPLGRTKAPTAHLAKAPPRRPSSSLAGAARRLPSNQRWRRRRGGPRRRFHRRRGE